MMLTKKTYVLDRDECRKLAEFITSEFGIKNIVSIKGDVETPIEIEILELEGTDSIGN